MSKFLRNKICDSLLLFFIAFTAYGLIFSGFGNFNTMSRFGLSISLVEHGSLYIDDFATLTADRATLGDHFASSKAPGMSFLAVPAVATAMKVLGLVNPGLPGLQWAVPPQWMLWLATLTTSSLYAALAVVVLFRIGMLCNLSAQGALFGAIVYGFATPTWGWATTFFSHATCGAFLVFGLYLGIVLKTVPQLPKISVALGLAMGLVLGAAFVIEYTSALPAFLIAAYGVWVSFRFRQKQTAYFVGGIITGALVAVMPLGLYNSTLFGKIFAVSYTYSDYHEMNEGFWGMHLPNYAVAIKLLFGAERGLFWLSPILVLTPLGWWSMWTHNERPLAILCMAIFLTYWVINSGAINWWGGASTGPRFITPCMPFLALSFAWLWENSRPFFRHTLIAMAILSSLLCFAMAGIEVTAPDNVNVVLDLLLPNLIAVNIDNLILNRLGISPALGVAIYLALIGGGVLTLWQWSKKSDLQFAAPSS